MKARESKRQGFTLVEMAMVVSVVGLIATTMALTVRQAMQAKIADTTRQLADAGTTGGASITLGGMKFYEPATQNSSVTVNQTENASSNYDKGATNYSSNLSVTRNGSEQTAGPSEAGNDKDWLNTKW